MFIVVNVDVVNDDVCYILYGDIGVVINVDVGVLFIDCFEIVYDEFFF